MRNLALLTIAAWVVAANILVAGPAAQIRVGIVGVDAHGVPWTKTIQSAKPGSPIGMLEGAEVLKKAQGEAEQRGW